MSKEMYSAMDAFLALRDIDDDDVVGMLKSKNLQEGKAFSIQHGSQDLEAAKEFLEEEAGEVEIEVIDVDADSVDHIKNNEQYIGQGILRCNRCMANRFVDMDTLEASEGDSEVYNVDDECPHCHDAGAGYTLVGQVGKVEKAESEQPAADETDAVADNDEAPAEDEATFENDLEADQEESDDATESGDQEGEEDVAVDFLSSDDEESDGMETDTSEDELDDLDLPALGDEAEEDVTEDDDEDVSVKESYLNEEFVNKLAEDAWMMNRVISSMNNEEAYYGGWLYIWPDDETKEMCSYDFGDQESYDELRDTFLRTYKFYHADGLYAADPEVVEYAHKLDAQLHLAPIENLTNEKLSVNEDYAPASCEVVGDLLNMIASPENIEKIIVVDMSDEDAARDVFTGKHEDLPMNVVGSPCKSFDVQDGYLTCNIDTEAETGVTPLSTVLEMFGDDKTEKVLLWDQASGDEVFSGTKEDAINQFGSKGFISFETPAVIKVMIMNPSVLSTEEIEEQKQETDLEKLVTDVINANNLSVHKINKPITNEYWINDAIMNNEDVDVIFETFVRPLENKELTSKFKALTGYTTALDEAYDAGFEAAQKESETEEPVAESFTNAEFNEFRALCKELGLNSMMDVAKFAEEAGGVSDQELLDALRNAVAANVEPEPEHPTCDRCGIRLNDGGTCPVCDDGEEDYFDESVKSFKSRKELSEAIEECKNNNKAYTVRRSTTEGFRYDLVLHEGDDTNAVVPAKRYTPVQKQVMDQIHRIAHDIADSVNRYYGIDADPAIVVADILQDLKLVSGEMDPEELADTPANNLTKQMYRSYEDFYAFVDAMISGVTGQPFRTTPQQKLEQAKQMLFSKAFSTEAIDAGIASTQFLNAVRGGNVAYIPSDTTPLLPENLEEDLENLEDDHVCETCGCTPCECILEESVDVNVEKFDEDMNAYFLEAYDSAVLYTTTSGEVKDNGEIILEGVINFIDDDQLTDVKFTLTPDAANTVYESVDDFSEDLTYRVTNNLSEEVFEFSFKDTLDE